ESPPAAKPQQRQRISTLLHLLTPKSDIAFFIDFQLLNFIRGLNLFFTEKRFFLPEPGTKF
ncbi:MAG: hypothetical protein KDK61_04535, partial [Simkania sp.]|nr:hypothetical protein [Simkania sp.]